MHKGEWTYSIGKKKNRTFLWKELSELRRKLRAHEGHLTAVFAPIGQISVMEIIFWSANKSICKHMSLQITMNIFYQSTINRDDFS